MKKAILIFVALALLPGLATAKLSVGIEGAKLSGDVSGKLATGYCIDKTWKVFGNFGLLTSYSNVDLSESGALLSVKTSAVGLLKQRPLGAGWLTIAPKLAYVDIQTKRVPVGQDFWSLSQYGVNERYFSPGLSVGYIPGGLLSHLWFEAGYQYVDSKPRLIENLSPVTFAVKLIL